MDRASDNAITSGNVITQSSLSIIPNPVSSTNATAIYQLAKDGNTTLEIVDLLGRRVYSQNMGVQNAGQHNYLLYNVTNRLRSGYYVVVLKQGNEIVARNRFVVSK